MSMFLARTQDQSSSSSAAWRRRRDTPTINQFNACYRVCVSIRGALPLGPCNCDVTADYDCLSRNECCLVSRLICHCAPRVRRQFCSGQAAGIMWARDGCNAPRLLRQLYRWCASTYVYSARAIAAVRCEPVCHSPSLSSSSSSS